MIRVEAPSRLHFGLLALPGGAAWPDLDGQPRITPRTFGGVGLMIDKPKIALTVEQSQEWSAAGPGATRALAVAKTLTPRPFAIRIERCPQEHIGLGTGTQLSLAVAQAISLATESVHVSASDLAIRVGRGRRSAIGIHGFAQGGFIVEAGKTGATTIAPVATRHVFPLEWSVLLVTSRGLQGDHGAREANAFELLKPDLAQTEALCRLVLLGMIPAIVERDLNAFGEALYDFNRRAGELFRPWQGSVFSHPRVSEIIGCLRQMGVKGVGQSSWGPTVFAVVSNQQCEEFKARLEKSYGAEQNEIVVTRACNSGAAATVTLPQGQADQGR